MPRLPQRGAPTVACGQRSCLHTPTMAPCTRAPCAAKQHPPAHRSPTPSLLAGADPLAPTTGVPWPLRGKPPWLRSPGSLLPCLWPARWLLGVATPSLGHGGGKPYGERGGRQAERLLRQRILHLGRRDARIQRSHPRRDARRLKANPCLSYRIDPWFLHGRFLHEQGNVKVSFTLVN